MHTESNPQQPAITATPANSPEATTTASEAASQATTAEPKPTAAKKPTGKRPARQRAATRPTAVNKPAAKKKAETAQSTKPATVPSAKGPQEGSTMWAVLKVLGDATEPLSAKDIYARIAERKLATGLKGKTPDQTIAAKLAVSAKKGEYVERAAPGKFQLLKERS